MSNEDARLSRRSKISSLFQNTDRLIALSSAITGVIGACAAIAVVPEFRCWLLSDSCSVSPSASALATFPTILGLTGFVVFFFLRQDHAGNSITHSIVAKLRERSSETQVNHPERLSSSALTKLIDRDTTLRKAVGEQDFQLLKDALHHQFVVSLVVYGSCTIAFLVGISIYAYLQQPGSFNQRLTFKLGSNDAVQIAGSVDLQYGQEKHSATFIDATDVAVEGLSTKMLGHVFQLILKSQDYELSDTRNYIFSRDPIAVFVHGKPFQPYAGSVHMRDTPIENSLVSLFSTPCVATTQRGGYFEFQGCEPSRRLQAPQLVLALPGTPSPCTGRFPLLKPPAITTLVVNPDCTLVSQNPAVPSPPKDGSVCQAALIGEIKSRFRTNHSSNIQSCTLTCHVSVSNGLARSEPGALEFRAPVACADGAFILRAEQLQASVFDQDR